MRYSLARCAAVHEISTLFIERLLLLKTGALGVCGGVGVGVGPGGVGVGVGLGGVGGGVAAVRTACAVALHAYPPSFHARTVKLYHVFTRRFHMFMLVLVVLPILFHLLLFHQYTVYDVARATAFQYRHSINSFFWG
jgi:hypothetical protein